MITRKEYGQAAIVFILMSLVFFWPLFQGRILSQADVVHFFPPWTLQKPPDLVAPSNAVLGDQTREFLTFFQVARESFHRMEFPLWNPYIMAGTPLLADSQSALLFPPNWSFYFLPLFLGFTVSALLKMLIASMGTYAFSRRLSVSHLSAILSGTTYTFSVFNVFWLNHPHTNATIFFPVLLLLADTIQGGPISFCHGSFGTDRRGPASGRPCGNRFPNCICRHPLLPLPADRLPERLEGLIPPVKDLCGGLHPGIFSGGALMIPFLEFLSQSATWEVRSGANVFFIEPMGLSQSVSFRHFYAIK